MYATTTRSKDLVRLRALYSRMMDAGSVPNEVEACRKHINSLLSKHGWKSSILGSGFTISQEPFHRKVRAQRHGDARNLSIEDKFNIIRLHNKGLTNQEIALKVKASPLYVGKFLNGLGFKLKRGRRKTAS